MNTINTIHTVYEFNHAIQLFLVNIETKYNKQ